MANFPFQTAPTAFPSDEIDPKAKDAKWVKEYGKALYASFTSSGREEFFNARDAYAEQRDYCRGQQSISRYEKQKKKPQTAGSVNVDQNLDLRVFMLAPYYVNVAIGLLSRASFDPVCQPVDTFSIDEAKDKKIKLLAMMQQKQFLNSLGITSPSLEGLPTDEEELELHLEIKGKPRAALEMEVKLQKDLDNSNFVQLSAEVDRDLVEVGPACYEDCGYGGKFWVERVRPEDFVVGPSNYEDFRDARYMGRIIPMTVGEIKKKAGTELDGQYAQIAQLAGRGSVVGDFNTQRLNYDDSRMAEQKMVSVLHFEFKSENTSVFKSKPSRYGNPIIRPRGYGYNLPEGEEGEVIRDTRTVLYEGYWIIGTEHAWGCRLKPNMQLDPVSEIPRFRWHPYRPMTPCVGRQVLSSIDFIMQMRKKMHDLIARSVPKGYKYDLDAIDNITLKKGAAKLTTQDIIKFHRATGDYLYRSRDVFNKDNGRAASEGIAEIENSISADLERLWLSIQNEIALLEKITSLSGAAAANDPRPEVGKGTTEIAIEGTNNALEYLYKAKRMMSTSLWKNIIIARRDREEMRPDGDKDIARRLLDVRADQRPTERQWQDVYAKADRALEKKEITMADFVKITRARTLAEAQLILIVRERQNDVKMAEAAKANQEATFQAQTAAPKVAEEERRKTLEFEDQLHAKKTDRELTKQLAIERERWAHEEKLEAMRLGVKAGSDHMADQTKREVEAGKLFVAANKATADSAKKD